MKTNPMAMETISRNTIFTNVAETSDGGVFWEGLEGEVSRTTKIKSWLGVEDWHAEQGKPAAHPNSRSVHSTEHQISPLFCTAVTCMAWSDVGLNVFVFSPTGSVHQQPSALLWTRDGRIQRVFPLRLSSLVAADLKVGGADCLRRSRCSSVLLIC